MFLWRRNAWKLQAHHSEASSLTLAPPLQVTDFQGLLAIRAGLAAAQATQNPICFSLIPEMFPRQRNLAMSAYNSAIYAGRALSYGAVLVAAKLSEASAQGKTGVTLASPDPCLPHLVEL